MTYGGGGLPGQTMREGCSLVFEAIALSAVWVRMESDNIALGLLGCWQCSSGRGPQGKAFSPGVAPCPLPTHAPAHTSLET